jgi:putative tricarboxylic transport membrane protein
MKLARGDFYSGLALGALAAYIIVAASRWEYVGTDGPGPGFFPLWYGLAMAALSGVLVVSSVLRHSASSIEWPKVRRALGAWLALALSIALFKLIGFLAGFAALTFFIVAVMYRRPLATAAVVAIAIAAGFYVVFPLALGLVLPIGVLGF